MNSNDWETGALEQLKKAEETVKFRRFNALPPAWNDSIGQKAVHPDPLQTAQAQLSKTMIESLRNLFPDPPTIPDLVFTSRADGIQVIVPEGFIRHHGVNYGDEVRKRLTAAMIERVAGALQLSSEQNVETGELTVTARMKL